MSTKLIMTLEKEIIETAKTYAESHKRSLSKLLEDYLRSIIEQDDQSETKIPLTPIVKSLIGSG